MGWGVPMKNMNYERNPSELTIFFNDIWSTNQMKAIHKKFHIYLSQLLKKLKKLTYRADKKNPKNLINTKFKKREHNAFYKSFIKSK